MTPWICVFFGLLFFAVGLAYLYQPRLIERMNALLRDYVLNDAYIALHRKKWGVSLLLIALLLVYVGYLGLEKFR